MNKNILICIILLGIGQILVWFQLNGQFVWKWFEKNPLLLTLLGIPISYVFIIGTKYGYEAFDGVLWAQRLIGFGLGIVCFTFCTYYWLGEGITPKTLTSLGLALTLVAIQIFWK